MFVLQRTQKMYINIPQVLSEEVLLFNRGMVVTIHVKTYVRVCHMQIVNALTAKVLVAVNS